MTTMNQHTTDPLSGGDAVETHDGEAARLLMRAVRGIADSELALVAAVAHARATGYSWRAVGAWLGVTREAAYQRFAQKVARLDDDTVSEALQPLQAADRDFMGH